MSDLTISKPVTRRFPNTPYAFGLALALLWFVASVVIVVGSVTAQREGFTSILALVLVGFSLLIPQTIAIQLHSTLEGFALVTVILEPVIGFGLGWLGHYLWQKGTRVRWIVPVLLVVNSLLTGVMFVLLTVAG